MIGTSELKHMATLVVACLAIAFATPAYAKRGQPDTTNDNDGVLHRAQGADGAWPKMTHVGDSLTGTLTIGIARVA